MTTGGVCEVNKREIKTKVIQRAPVVLLPLSKQHSGRGRGDDREQRENRARGHLRLAHCGIKLKFKNGHRLATSHSGGDQG